MPEKEWSKKLQKQLEIYLETKTEETYIPPEKRRQIIDDLKLF